MVPQISQLFLFSLQGAQMPSRGKVISAASSLSTISLFQSHSFTFRLSSLFKATILDSYCVGPPVMLQLALTLQGNLKSYPNLSYIAPGRHFFSAVAILFTALQHSPYNKSRGLLPKQVGEFLRAINTCLAIYQSPFSLWSIFSWVGLYKSSVEVTRIIITLVCCKHLLDQMHKSKCWEDNHSLFYLFG